MDFDFSLKMDGNRHVAVGGFEREKTSFFRLARQILQPKSGIFGEKFNEVGRKKGFFIAKGSHRNMSNNPAIARNSGETERKKK